MAAVESLSELAGPRGEGEPGGVLKHSDGPWLRAARGADELVSHLGPVHSELATAHEGLTDGAGQLSALAELAAVRESWERRIQAARGECGSLAGKLRSVAQAQGATNEAVRSSFAPEVPRGGEDR
ncbi:hypothetical protein OG206_15320 [Streptomyces sp. NBC_01341]|uniref:hypothetical protein n=1 Tax=Streptomyces sp. NBC_01341 TaxID=2903831 RepID=UPI002E0E2CBE|nr:hypothetical protein OG206_15320 [Streptomyces sp. NBC_01341]